METSGVGVVSARCLMSEWELPDEQLPVDPPLGADCDTDAIWESEERIQRAIRVWTNPFKPPPHFPTSSQCRGDGATGPGGGAPTSNESGTLTDSAPAR